MLPRGVISNRSSGRDLRASQAWNQPSERRPFHTSIVGGGIMISLKVNGKGHEIDADPTTPLLYVLRNELGLNGAKFGCGLGQCGSCTVMVNGDAVLSCVIPIILVNGREITTIEGLGTLEEPGPMQRAFIELQAAQCGYCIPGMMMRAEALLRRNPAASEAEIRAALEPN